MRSSLLVPLLVALAGCSADPTGGSTDGATVYDGACASCHGKTGHPPEQMVKQLNVRDLGAPEMRARITPELVEKQVRAGSANKLMPSFQGALTDAQIKAVAAYVASPGFLNR